MQVYNGIDVSTLSPKQASVLCKSIEFCGIIYSYTNALNGKKYVGQTIQPQERHVSHVRNYYRIQDRTPLHLAISKYGTENFIYTVEDFIIAKNKDELQRKLNESEIHYINKYQTLIKSCGYNVKPGGQFNQVYVGNTPMVRPVDMYSLDGKFIRSFESISAAQNFVGISGSSISKVCDGFGHTSCGYLWAWKDMPVKIPQQKEVCQYDLEGKFIASYPTALAATRALGVGNGISNAINDRYRIAYGSYWRRYRADRIPITDFPKAIFSYDLEGKFLKGYITLSDAIKDVNASGSSAICGAITRNQKYRGRLWRRFYVEQLDYDDVPAQGCSVKIEYPDGVVKIYYQIIHAALDNGWTLNGVKLALDGANVSELGDVIATRYKDSMNPAEHPDYIFVKGAEVKDKKLIRHEAVRIKVDQYTKDGVFVATYNTIAEAERAVDTYNIPQAIVKHYLCAGFIWVRHGESIPSELIDKIDSQKVYQYDSEGNYVGEHADRQTAALAIGYKSSNSHIGRCIREPWRTAKGFYWRDKKYNKIEIVNGNKKTNTAKESNDKF